MAESDEIDEAIGDDGRSRGRMQINEDFREFGDWPRAVSAYNQGAAATRRRGVRPEYLRRVEGKMGCKVADIAI
jgi:hypothetical protein